MIYFIQKGRMEELLIEEEKYLMLLDVLKSFKNIEQSQFDMLKRLFTEYEEVEEVEEASKLKQAKTKQTKQ